MPEPYPGGGIPTLNDMGAMAPDIDDPITIDFINYAKTLKKSDHILEIGAAYGNVELNLLKNSVVSITANDLDKRHLDILYNRALECCKSSIHRLTLDSSEFPNKSKLENNKFKAILISRVLHFMNPKQIEDAISKLHDLLVPGGMAYVITLSPYAYDSFLPEYIKRVQKGEEWPGFVENIQIFSDKAHTDPRLYKILYMRQYNLLEVSGLKKLFIKGGFKVQESYGFKFDNQTDKWVHNNKAALVGLVAVKQ
jgi:SAM-dependent methyltransferase